MKRTFLFAVTVLAALLATSCQKEEMGRVLTATIEQYVHNGDSKAYINAQNYACWEAGDKVNINGTQYTIGVEGGDGRPSAATIEGTEDLAERPLLAFYPAGMVTSLASTGGTVTLPQVQYYEETTVGGVTYQKIQNPMAAYCPGGSDELKFRNLGALVEVTIHATEDLSLKAIQVKGDDDQMLWGTAQLQLNSQDKPMLNKMTDGGAFVRLSFEKHPVVISANSSKSFYIVVPAGSNFFDFSILVYTGQEKSYRKESAIDQTLPRNHIGAIAYTPADVDTVCAILYTGSVGTFGENAFGDAQVISAKDGAILLDRRVTEIGNNAFCGFGSLTSIDLPQVITSIGGSAFQGCGSLTSIDLPQGITSIGESAFQGCGSLTSIDLSHTEVTSIMSNTFTVCGELSDVSFPQDLDSIGDYAFSYCSALTSITFPPNLNTIGDRAFYFCSSLISVSLPASLTTIRGEAFYYCSRLAQVDSYRAEPPTLGTRAFWHISGSAELHVPSGSKVFYYSNWSSYFGERIYEDL